MKNISVFYLKIFSSWGVKFSIYLNRSVFVMISSGLTSGILLSSYIANVFIGCAASLTGLDLY